MAELDGGREGVGWLMNPASKAELRTAMRERLRSLTASDRAAASAKVRERVEQLSAWRAARRVLLFAPRVDELDLWELALQAVAAGKEIALPAFDAPTRVYGARRLVDPERGIVPGRFGVGEPGPDCPEVSLATLDLAVVPGLAFTAEGGRLGRGGGFYDRLLGVTRAIRVGVGLDAQVLDWLPSEPHDANLDYVLTPSATHACRKGSD